ncbi:pentatricopeptide repeat-containing protein At1g08070, chloroplastic-like [Castanea sativa]|uniref:pentatricopeptide repeat-containing protein At1g08070, chloroplastic-like n=1 Tax=Castanea sativa TaxID=21020 RepID=UPI003F64967B
MLSCSSPCKQLLFIPVSFHVQSLLTQQQCISLYNLMRCLFGLFLDRHSFPFLFKACARLSLSHKGQEVHSLTFKLGLQHDVFIQNALLSMYSFCGLLHSSRQVFDEIPLSVRDVVSWNSMVFGYIQGRCYWDALKMFDEMLKCDVNARPDEVTFINALTACARIGFLDMGRKIHVLLVQNEFVLDVILGSSLVDMYAKCGQMEHARKVFDTILDKNVVCWTCLIAGYAHSHLFKESIELFREMQARGVTADAATIACVISSCGHSGALDQGRWAHTHCERSGIHFNLSVKNALIDMCSKCGDIQRALKIFHALNLTERDVFSWTAMITGLAMNGLSEEALSLFSQMEMSGGIVRPNEVTFLGVLSACCHAGLVDKGFHYFNHMTQSYNLKPRIEHYGCMVDLLGHSNLLAEAERFISAMPIQPDVIWRSLLFASGSHGNIELAEFPAKRIEELEPKKCGARVLLSNVYASAWRWSDVKNMRKSMALRSIQKLPGCSFIEIDGVVHEFFVADDLHCQIYSIYETIIQINEVIQAEGFDPEI